MFLCICTTIVLAQNSWESPVEPETPDAVEFVTGGTYFVRNVGTGQFLTYGCAWGTQISLTMNGLNDEANKAIALDITEGTETLGGAIVSGYKLQLHGTFGGKTNTYLFRDSEEDGFIEYNNQGRGVVWKITKVGDYYRIQTADGDPAYPSSSTQYAGWIGLIVARIPDTIAVVIHNGPHIIFVWLEVFKSGHAIFHTHFPYRIVGAGEQLDDNSGIRHIHATDVQHQQAEIVIALDLDTLFIGFRGLTVDINKGR